MDCKHVDAILMDYLYQELDPSEAEHVAAHLQTCARCAGELSACERTRAAMRDPPELEPSASLDDVLLREAAKAVRLQPEPAPSFWQRVRESMRVLVLNPAMTAAVTLVVVLGISFVIYRNSEPPRHGLDIEQPMPPAAGVITDEKARAAGSAPITAQASGSAVARDDEGKNRKAAGEARQEAVVADSRERAKAVSGPRGRASLEQAQAAPAPHALARDSERAGAGPGDGWRRARSRRAPVAANRPALRFAKDAPYADDRDKAEGQAGPRAPGAAAGGKLDDAVKEKTGKLGGALAGQTRATPKPVTLAKAEPPAKASPPAAPAEAKPAYQASSASPARPALRGQAGGGGSVKEEPLANATLYKKAPQHKGSAGSSLDSLGGLASSSEAGSGKGKAGQAAALKQQSVSFAGADYWIKQGAAAQKRGDCSRALAAYEHALALDPKLAPRVASSVRSCAASLNETALAEAKKLNPRLAGFLNVEVARRKSLRQQRTLELESKRRASKAKAKAAPAKAAPAQAD